MSKDLARLTILQRSLLLAIFYAAFWMAVHFIAIGPPENPVWVPLQLLISTLFFFVINGLFASFDYYRWRRWGHFAVATIYVHPLFQILYYRTYKTFMDHQQISLLIREPNFLLKIFVSEMSLIRGSALLVGVVFFWKASELVLKREGLEKRRIKPYDFFASKYSLVFTVVMIALQIQWCLQHDTSQLAMRPLYPVTLMALISVVVFLTRTKSAVLERLIVLFLIFGNLTLLYALNLSFVEAGHRFTADSQHYRALFGAFFVQTSFSSLEQNGDAHLKFAALPAASMDYNILISLNDTQRWDHLSSNGYPRPTDDELDWFHKKAFKFKFPIAPANGTDTSVPGILYGLGSEQDVRKIKSSLAVWDFFAKTANTFFVSSQDVTWSRLHLMYGSFGQKHVWSATAQPDYRGNPEDTNDISSYNYLKDYLPALKSPWVGVWQTFAPHYPYTVNPEFHRYEPCNLAGRGDRIEEFRNCYLNAQVYSAHLRSQLFKKLDLEKTVIVLTSDHGEGMDEHGVFFHGVGYNQEIVKVPLDLYIPPAMLEKLPPNAVENLKKNTGRVVSVMDLVPTLLHLHEMLSGQALEDRKVFSGLSLFENWPYRVVFSSECIPQYRCYSREMLFADDEYYVIFKPAEGFRRVYSTWSDPEQKDPLTFDRIDLAKFERLVAESARIHPVGQTMKAYYEGLKARGFKSF